MEFLIHFALGVCALWAGIICFVYLFNKCTAAGVDWKKGVWRLSLGRCGDAPIEEYEHYASLWVRRGIIAVGVTWAIMLPFVGGAVLW